MSWPKSSVTLTVALLLTSDLSESKSFKIDDNIQKNHSEFIVPKIASMNLIDKKKFNSIVVENKINSTSKIEKSKKHIRALEETQEDDEEPPNILCPEVRSGGEAIGDSNDKIAPIITSEMESEEISKEPEPMEVPPPFNWENVGEDDDDDGEDDDEEYDDELLPQVDEQNIIIPDEKDLHRTEEYEGDKDKAEEDKQEEQENKEQEEDKQEEQENKEQEEDKHEEEEDKQEEEDKHEEDKEVRADVNQPEKKEDEISKHQEDTLSSCMGFDKSDVVIKISINGGDDCTEEKSKGDVSEAIKSVDAVSSKNDDDYNERIVSFNETDSQMEKSYEHYKLKNQYDMGQITINNETGEDTNKFNENYYDTQIENYYDSNDYDYESAFGYEN